MYDIYFALNVVVKFYRSRLVIRISINKNDTNKLYLMMYGGLVH